jgi:hypothetical protein
LSLPKQFGERKTQAQNRGMKIFSREEKEETGKKRENNNRMQLFSPRRTRDSRLVSPSLTKRERREEKSEEKVWTRRKESHLGVDGDTLERRGLT